MSKNCKFRSFFIFILIVGISFILLLVSVGIFSVSRSRQEASAAVLQEPFPAVHYYSDDQSSFGVAQFFYPYSDNSDGIGQFYVTSRDWNGNSFTSFADFAFVSNYYSDFRDLGIISLFNVVSEGNSTYMCYVELFNMWDLYQINWENNSVSSISLLLDYLPQPVSVRSFYYDEMYLNGDYSVLPNSFSLDYSVIEFNYSINGRDGSIIFGVLDEYDLSFSASSVDFHYSSYYNQGYDEGYNSGFDDGEDLGFDIGYAEGVSTSFSDISPFDMIVQGVSSFFSLELFPGFPLYTVFLISIGMLLLGIVFKIFFHG